MVIRRATVSDIPALVEIRASVRENILTSEISEERIVAGLEERGRGWVAEHDERIVGFSMADSIDSLIWALFLRPECEGRGIGRALLVEAVEWLWSQGSERIWLTTDPGTRAAGFYEHMGWTRTGMTERGEARFELLRPTPAAFDEGQVGL